MQITPMQITHMCFCLVIGVLTHDLRSIGFDLHSVFARMSNMQVPTSICGFQPCCPCNVIHRPVRPFACQYRFHLLSGVGTSTVCGFANVFANAMFSSNTMFPQSIFLVPRLHGAPPGRTKACRSPLASSCIAVQLTADVSCVEKY